MFEDIIKQLDTNWNPSISHVIGSVTSNNHSRANEAISLVAFNVAFRTFEKTKAAVGKDAEALNDVFGTLRSREYLDTPAKPLRLCKEKLSEYNDSPVVESLRDFVDHIENMHKLSYSFEGTDQDVVEGALKELGDKAIYIAQKSHEASLGNGEFKVLFDDPNFQDIKKQWEGSRAAWAGRQYQGPMYEREGVLQADNIERLLEPLNEALTQYADKIKEDPEKAAAVAEMHKRVNTEGLCLLIEKATMRNDKEELKRLERRVSDLNIAQESRNTTLAEVNTKAEAKKEANAKKTEGARETEARLVIIKDSLHDFKLSDKDRGVAASYMQKQMEGLSSQDLDAHKDDITEGLTSAIRANISNLLFGSSAINVDGLKGTKIQAIDDIKNPSLPSIDAAEAAVKSAADTHSVVSELRTQFETRKPSQGGYISNINNARGKVAHTRS